MRLNDHLIAEIADKNVDVDKFAKIVTNDNKLRDEIIYLMMNDPNIMVYYHSYYVVSKASEIRPELFYGYWNDFASLLQHKNSYHRNFGLTLIANLTEVDREDKFSKIFDDYFKCIDDVKFMTAEHCIQNIKKILVNKEELREDIINILLDVDEVCNFPQKQKALLKSEIIKVFDGSYKKIENKEKLNEFVKAEIGSISPKTRKLAREFVLKHGL